MFIMNLPQGQGMYIWRISYCMKNLRDEKGLDSIVKKCLSHNISWVAIKICDGVVEYLFNKPYTALLTKKLKAAGIKVWGWGWTYGRYNGKIIAIREASTAARLVLRYEMEGFIIDAEHDYKVGGSMWNVAKMYSRELRDCLGDLPIGLSSYRYPELHKTFPWKAFDFDFHAPQVYWENDNRPTAGWTQVMKSFTQLRNYVGDKPIVPVGPTYSRGAWTPTAEQRRQFVDAAKAEGCKAWFWWSWQHTNENAWEELKAYDVGTPPIAIPDNALEQLWLEAIKRGWF